MSEMATRVVNALAVPLPAARCDVTVRQAVASDLAFIDQLQKMHTHMVGWFPTKQIEKNIADGNVVIAEAVNEPRPSGSGASTPGTCEGPPLEPLPHGRGSLQPLGYCIAKDQYMKRDDVGIVYQLNVLPLKQRHLVGATLIKAVFDRAAYGCRLFCCWCAQDIQANFFWESIGFVPLAFRTGSRAKQRIHIFWQKRIREGDESTPYWFPSQTTGGAVAEDRIVLPIPPDTHWRDAKPILLPGMNVEPAEAETKALPGGAAVRPRPEQPKVSAAQRMAIVRAESRHLKGLPPGKAAVITSGGVRYIDRADYVPEPEQEKPRKPRKPRAKHHPEFVKKARELRDRYLEQVNSGMLLPASAAKYEVSRQLSSGAAAARTGQTPLLEAA